MYKKIILLIAVLLITIPPVSADEREAINLCLQHWGTHPFNSQNPSYRVIRAKVKVFGIGEDVYDDRVTSTPELILVKPNVSVISDAKMQLLNPNGWYCLHNKVNVIAKTEIVLHCNAKLISTKGSFSLIAKDQEKQGVTVIGKNKIIRNCSNNSAGTGTDSSLNVSNTQYDSGTIREAQYRLNAKGYKTGYIDGRWGSRSKTAMREFQQNQGLEATGELNAESLDALGIKGLTKVDSQAADTNMTTEEAAASHEMKSQHKKAGCTVKQVLSMEESGLSDEQIHAACGQ